MPGYKDPPKETQFKPGQSGNPKGYTPGQKNLSTHIRELLEDETFTADIVEGYALKTYTGAPVKAIVRVAALKALAGDNKWADWLAKYGFGQKFELEHSGEIGTGEVDTVKAEAFAEFLAKKTQGE